MDMIVSKVFHEFCMILFLQLLLNQFLELNLFCVRGSMGIVQATEDVIHGYWKNFLILFVIFRIF